MRHAWETQGALDVPTLIQQVQRPPIERIGVFDMDSFFPQKAPLRRWRSRSTTSSPRPDSPAGAKANRSTSTTSSSHRRASPAPPSSTWRTCRKNSVTSSSRSSSKNCGRGFAARPARARCAPCSSSTKSSATCRLTPTTRPPKSR